MIKYNFSSKRTDGFFKIKLVDTRLYGNKTTDQPPSEIRDPYNIMHYWMSFSIIIATTNTDS